MRSYWNNYMCTNMATSLNKKKGVGPEEKTNTFDTPLQEITIGIQMQKPFPFEILRVLK